ncbi:MAG: DUF58 domain-containing protein [Acidobacteria bacterium]|nr:DUF58 domain-containing protein [Acidobacteriota bacterium]
MATATQTLIDKSFLERLERLTIHWQKSFPGLVGGHNASRFPGAGQEFLDHRNFHHGDDLRAVNWRAYLRLEKLFLKMFQVEPRVPVRLLLDTSATMGTGTPPKFDYARKLAAALAYVGLVRLDTIVLCPFDSALGQEQVCSGGRHRFGPVSDYLSRLELTGTTDFLAVARKFAGKYVNRGLLVIVSDFDPDQDCEKPLQYLAEFGHELFLVHLWADEDRIPPWDGELDLTHAESGAKLEIDFDPGARERYTQAFDEYGEQLRRIALRHGGRYVGLPVSMPVEEAVFGPMVRARGVE